MWASEGPERLLRRAAAPVGGPWARQSKAVSQGLRGAMAQGAHGREG